MGKIKILNNLDIPESEIFLNAALSYAALGLPVIPLHTINQKGYCTCGMGKDCVSPGKHPETIHGIKDASTDIEKIKRWWPRGVLPSNIGIVTGGKSGLVVIDVDGDEGFDALGAERVKDLKDKSLPRVKTGRGFHNYFWSSTPIKTKQGFVNKVDIKGEGGYVVAVPSKHISGIRYEWIKKVDGFLPDVPPWVNGQSVEKQSQKVSNNIIPEGQRNGTLFKLACSFRAKDVSYETTALALEAENQKRCNPPLSETEVNNILNSAYKYEPASVNSFNCTDLGNAKRLVSQYGAKIRYCHVWKKWLCWDGKTWSIDNNGQILRLAKDVVKGIYAETVYSADSGGREKIAKWGIKSEDEKRIRAMVSLAQSEEGVPISPQELDVNPYLLNCQNGTIDLKTGQLQPHNPQNFVTKIIFAECRPNAECPQWKEFLETIFNFNYDIIQFIQRAVGYTLTGDVSEQCLFMPYGHGANGKSTFIDVVSMLLGDYAQGADFETFLIRKNETIRNDLARMTGRRFISAIESEGERRLAEVLVKQLTGGDTITARFLFGEYFEFQPTFKIWLATNHKPSIRGTDYAIWRRIKLIPFNITIPEEKRISKTILMDTFKKELPGILTWAVEGCLEWQRTGLQTPGEVRSATNAYREEMDGIGTFLKECCILNPEVRTKSGDLYEAYKKWCIDNGEYAIGNRHFGRRLSERGFQNQQSNGNWWKGIGMKV